jgi:hypothetical protein
LLFYAWFEINSNHFEVGRSFMAADATRSTAENKKKRARKAEAFEVAVIKQFNRVVY